MKNNTNGNIMKNSVTGNIIKLGFVTDLFIKSLYNWNVSLYNENLRKEAEEKRKLCYEIELSSTGETIAYYRKTLDDGRIYEWEEKINKDPFRLYSIF